MLCKSSKNLGTLMRDLEKSAEEEKRFISRQGKRKFWMGFFVGISACSFFYNILIQADAKILKSSLRPHVQVQQGYSHPSKVEVECENRDKSDPLPETYLYIDETRYHLKYNEKGEPGILLSK